MRSAPALNQNVQVIGENKLMHTTSARVRGGERGQGFLQIIYSINLLFCIAQLQAYGGTCRRDMFERRGSWESQCLLKFLHERVRVQRIEEVDITRSAEQSWACKLHQRKRLFALQGIIPIPLNGNSRSVTKACAGFW